MNKWQRKVDALIRLAEDQRGKPEGDLAREKLTEILNKHPEAQRYPPMVDLVHRDFQAADVVVLKRRGIPTGGSWTGRSLDEALQLMMEDYARRLKIRGLIEEDVDPGTEDARYDGDVMTRAEVEANYLGCFPYPTEEERAACKELAAERFVEGGPDDQLE